MKINHPQIHLNMPTKIHLNQFSRCRVINGLTLLSFIYLGDDFGTSGCSEQAYRGGHLSCLLSIMATKYYYVYLNSDVKATCGEVLWINNEPLALALTLTNCLK